MDIGELSKANLERERCTDGHENEDENVSTLQRLQC